MAKIFISYSRGSEDIARELANDIDALGHSPWFDEQLTGGQDWWDRILATILDHDVFVFLLDRSSLKSTACTREYKYADALGKPILPVMVSGNIDENVMLPPALARVQYVDYRNQDPNAWRRLAQALNALPPSKPLPDPLPTPPEVPISYLASIAEKVHSESILSPDDQRVLVSQIREALRDPESADNGGRLLKVMRQRRDLLVIIADEIDELLAGTDEETTGRPGSPESRRVDAEKERAEQMEGEKIKPVGRSTIEQKNRTATNTKGRTASTEEPDNTKKAGQRIGSSALSWIASVAILVAAFALGILVGQLLWDSFGSDLWSWVGAISTWLAGIWLTWFAWRRLRELA